jgi:hypothetical protein
LDAGVLDMLRDRKEPCFDDQCAKPAADLFLPEPDMLGDRQPKVPPPTTITSNGRPPADVQALTSETSLQR